MTPAEPDAPTATAEPRARFDLMSSERPSFSQLDDARAEIYSSAERLRSFQALVDGLPPSGEEGRRKGLGLWMLGRHVEAIDVLAAHPKDAVAAYTRAKALMALHRYAEAAPILTELSEAYPDEPSPRAGMLEARAEAALAADDWDTALDSLVQGIDNAPASFADTAEQSYVRGRLAELERDPEAAINAYVAAKERDPSMRTAVFRAAHLAERSGLDDLALDLYEQLCQYRPIDANVLINLGVLYEDAGRDQDAAACYETVVRSFPRNKRARLYLEDAKQAIDMYYDEDQERKEDRLNQILRIPITDFELSVRARNCLNKMNITTLGDLVCRTEQELLSYKNFGETSLNEIKEILHSKGLRLGMPRDEAVASVESAAHRARAGGEQDDTLNHPITELQLSIRARRTVEALGCLTVGDILKHSSDELLGMPNFGVTSLQELKNKLAELGLTLRGDKK